MPTSVSAGAYIAALHKKLAQAERNLYEFRKIFEHFQESCGERPVEACDLTARREGLYPGQLDNMVDSTDSDSDVGECIE